MKFSVSNKGKQECDRFGSPTMGCEGNYSYLQIHIVELWQLVQVTVFMAPLVNMALEMHFVYNNLA